MEEEHGVGLTRTLVEVVDPECSVVAVGDLDEPHPRYAVEQLARGVHHALGVAQVAGVVVGHGDGCVADRVPGRHRAQLDEELREAAEDADEKADDGGEAE